MSKEDRPISDRAARGFFALSVACLLFGYGVAVGRFQVFPYAFLEHAVRGALELAARTDATRSFYYREIDYPIADASFTSDGACPGLSLVTQVAEEQQLEVKLLDMNQRPVHRWLIDWFAIWPDAEHVPAKRMPRSRPGTHVHGTVLMEDGDLVFNFEHLGLVRLDPAGEVVWRLPYQTHHSVHLHDDGNLWVCGQKAHPKRDPRFLNRVPPFSEYTVLEVSPDGDLLSEWSVADLLTRNGLPGLLYLGNLNNQAVHLRPGQDALHLNDVEPFPNTFEEGFFTRGDVLVSLRNVNTVFVFNRDTGKIKFITTGPFVRQHDPDFVDGNRFSVFDNNHIAPESHGHQSRIVMVSAPEHTTEVVFEGNREELPFYTDIMGKHQWLPNGNLLITESMRGRAFEIDRDGELVWQYVNALDDRTIGIVEEVQRLPLDTLEHFSPDAAGRDVERP